MKNVNLQVHLHMDVISSNPRPQWTSSLLLGHPLTLDELPDCISVPLVPGLDNELLDAVNLLAATSDLVCCVLCIVPSMVKIAPRKKKEE